MVLFFLIAALLIGIVSILLGISMTRGNLSSLHSYHRSRVKEEDRIPFGKLVGWGTNIIGLGCLCMGLFTGLDLWLKHDLYTLVGMALLFVGLTVGMVMSIYAMRKYNAGIF